LNDVNGRAFGSARFAVEIHQMPKEGRWPPPFHL